MTTPSSKAPEEELDDFGLPIYKPFVLPADDGASSSSEDELEVKVPESVKDAAEEQKHPVAEEKQKQEPPEVARHEDDDHHHQGKRDEPAVTETPPNVTTASSDGKITGTPQTGKLTSSTEVITKEAAKNDEHDSAAVSNEGDDAKEVDPKMTKTSEADTTTQANGTSEENTAPRDVESSKSSDGSATPATKPQERAPEDAAEASKPSSDSPTPAAKHARNQSLDEVVRDAAAAAQAANPMIQPISESKVANVSEWSHQQIVPQMTKKDAAPPLTDEWQEMPSYAPYDIYDDDGKLVAKEHENDSDDEYDPGVAGKGYTRVQVDEDAQSATSMDENTKYLFKDGELDDELARNPLEQLEATKDLLTEGQRVAYVGICRLTMAEMVKDLQKLDTKKVSVQKSMQIAVEHMKMWSQIIMVRLYKHMDITPAEQLMIEQLSEHGVVPADLTPTLMKNARVKNPMADESAKSAPGDSPKSRKNSFGSSLPGLSGKESETETETEARSSSSSPPPYEEHMHDELPGVRTPNQLPGSKTIDLDIRWTILCDLFLVLIADSVYDARSRTLLERVGKYLEVPWIDICKFERRVTDALEMQEATKQEWSDADILADRAKRARHKRYAMMGLATIGGGLVIGLSAGLLAPVIGAGLAAGFTTIGVAGTSGFLAGTGGAALITTTATVSGVTIAARAASNRSKSVKTFELRPLHNNKRLNLIITISGWMNGKEDDVRLPYSTVDPIMGDIFSVLWEPEVLQSMGQTIRILATEALTQSLQQVLGSTILMALMASLQLPIILTKLSYLIDNPWSVSLDRAWSAGLILADTIIARNLGVRPITLCGFSLGARVIFSALMELSRRNAHGLVQNVYMFGTPVVVNKDDYVAAASVVRGRFVNAYATNDWILGYLFRATSGGIGRVAGLKNIEGIPGIENYDVTSMVDGHMAYRAAIPKLLRTMGWDVESDTFSEIEEADPDKHRERQIELINDIEEARKALEEAQPKKRFAWLTGNKKAAKKKDWEVYDDKQKEGEKNPEEIGDVLFDVEAIKREIAAIEEEEKKNPGSMLNKAAAQKTDDYNTRASISSDRSSNMGSIGPASGNGYSNLNVAKRSSLAGLSFWSNKSHDSSLGRNSLKEVKEVTTPTTPKPGSQQRGISPPKRYSSLNFQNQYNPEKLQPEDNRAGKYTVSPRRSFSSTAYREYECDDHYPDDHSQGGDGAIQMTFDDGGWGDKKPDSKRSPSPPVRMTFESYDNHDNGLGYGGYKANSKNIGTAASPTLSFEPPTPKAGSFSPVPASTRPGITTSKTTPAKSNPWMDEEDEFAEKEVTMSFE